MKLISWNVNGLRACVNKGFLDFFKDDNKIQKICKKIYCKNDQNYPKLFSPYRA